MFFYFGTPHNSENGEDCHPNCYWWRFMEIGNNVFMAYKKVGEGQFEELEQKNVDHGSGLERIAAAKINDPDVFKISLMWPIIAKLEELSGKKYESHLESMRVIADHLRAATFLAVDGCVPSNKQQGYVMRRLIRRAIRYSFDLGIEQNFMQEIVPVIADLYVQDFPEVAEHHGDVIAVLVKEEKAFRQTIRKGINEFNKLAEEKDDLTGADVFRLYDTYGFPMEMTVEEAFHWSKPLEENWLHNFNAALQQQRQQSQTAAKGTFKGGLGGDSPQHRKYHTATHLMYRALKNVLGEHVIQRGSNITEERLRFDFSHDEKMTPDQIKQVEDIVNQKIADDMPVSWREENTKEALAAGVSGAFGDKYGETVKVYTIGDPDGEYFSREICGGPHVEHTGEIAEAGQQFKISKEESSSAGVRRIKAVVQ
jgi:alanyl-tRNA synthetase